VPVPSNPLRKLGFLTIGLFDEASVDPEVRVVVLAANGRHFCSGADVGGIKR